MLGLAKDLFKQGAVSLDDFAFSVRSQKPWPIVQRFLELGLFSFVDYSFAKTALNHDHNIDEDVASFLCYLMATSRGGHLCLTLDGENLLPDLLSSVSHIDKNEIFRLKESIVLGAEKLPEAILQIEGEEPLVKPVVRMGNHYYLSRNFRFESEVISHFLRLIAQTDVDAYCDQHLQDSLSQEQFAAVKKAACQQLFLLCGGPGTGKSYTAGKLMSLFQTTNPDMRIFAAAPTGKAAACLKEKVSANIEVGTLHSLLQIKRSEDLVLRNRSLPYDLIVVDEASMIDLPLFAAFFAAIDSGTRVILMGDHKQLPPVESGCVFRDLCQYAQQHCQPIFSELKECKRSDQRAIIGLSESVRSCDINDALIALHRTDGANVSYHNLPEGQNPIFPTWQDLDRYFPSPQDTEPNADELFANSGSFRVLSPLNVGPLGTKALNQVIWKHFLQKVENKKYWAIPIIITKTSYPLDLYNGEIGFLIRHLHNRCYHTLQFQQKDYAIFLDRSGSTYRKLPVAILPPYDHAYALTVHKSQGSEYHHIYFFLPEGADHFGQEMLYTGITRAKERLTLFSTDDIIKRCVQNLNTKHSILTGRLK